VEESMFVKEGIVESLCVDAGEHRVKRAKEYLEQSRVQISEIKYEDENEFQLHAKVRGTENYYTHIFVQKGEIEDLICSCKDYQKHRGACKHIIASMLAFQEQVLEENESEKNIQNKQLKNKINKAKYRSFHQIVNELYNEDIEERFEHKLQASKSEKIRLEPKLIFDRYTKQLKLEIKIGNKKMYKLKNLSEFYDNMFYGRNYKYGAQLEFMHIKQAFEDECLPILEFILKYAETIKYVNSESNPNYKYYGPTLSENSININNTALDEIFEILKNKKISLEKEYKEQKIEILDQNPNIEFKLDKTDENEYRLSTNIKNRITTISILEGKNNTYILGEKALYRCSKDYKETTLRLFKLFRENYLEEVYLDKSQVPELFSIVMPKIKNKIKMEQSLQEEIEKYRPQKLRVKVYLDFDEHNYIIADVKFCYGEEEFNPLEEEKNIKIKSTRNLIEETKIFNFFGKTGFMMYEEKKQFILPQEDKIYEFLSETIQDYMQRFEVLVTDNFKTKQIRQPQLGALGVKVENNLLSIDLSNLNVDAKTLQEIMTKYELKKKYHRLKDGSFLSLEPNSELDFLEKTITGMDIDYKDLEAGEIKLPVYRSLYLNELLKTINNIQINKNNEYRSIVNGLKEENIEETEIPQTLEKTLRYYQKTGFKWLKVLDSYKFGGILADDMGLGKTIQLLAVIIDYVKSSEQTKTSIVVCPSSLSLNWQNEAMKFAKDLKTLVIHGTAKEREKQIENLEKYDLIITSYDLLKRDIDIYKKKDYTFKFIIADEAQYLKNSNTQNAKSIKEIKAETRYALTGTPIENSLSELWSIFDFIMPGYLFTYKKFKNAFEVPIAKENSIQATQKLKMLIEPFVLRRTKKEVLTELPEKTVTVLNSEMKEEQEQIYIKYLAQIKQEVADLINEKGFEKNQIKILAGLTRLRQICCHPSLFLSNYDGKSSKLEQCMEIVEQGVQSGHKMLLFSVYTSMFEIIEKELQERNIKYFKLTGSTKVEERIDLVDEFNQNPDIKVFLVSLKAGGTGLNLIGADMVIHYDPWWNVSSENQATDRAYRIGQKNNVQVYKLITKNSIEEKIYELQQKKTELIDNVLDTQTTFINKLSKEDIINLFE
jgi:SNF2 family DNA or RNA helicase